MNSEDITPDDQPSGVRNATLRALKLRMAEQITNGDPQTFTTVLAYTTNFGPLPPDLTETLSEFCFAGFKKRAIELVAAERLTHADGIRCVEAVYGANWDSSDKMESRLRVGFMEFFDPPHRWCEESWREYAASRFAHHWMEHMLSLFNSRFEAKGQPAEVLQFVADVWDGGTGTASIPIYF